MSSMFGQDDANQDGDLSASESCFVAKFLTTVPRGSKVCTKLNIKYIYTVLLHIQAYCMNPFPCAHILL